MGVEMRKTKEFIFAIENYGCSKEARKISK